MNTKAYGALLAEYRLVSRLSQAEAGKRLGKARETLSLLERGAFSSPPTPQTMQRFEDVLGFPVLEQLHVLGYPVIRDPLSSVKLQALKALDDMPQELEAKAVAILRVLGMP